MVEVDYKELEIKNGYDFIDFIMFNTTRSCFLEELRSIFHRNPCSRWTLGIPGLRGHKGFYVWLVFGFFPKWTYPISSANRWTE